MDVIVVAAAELMVNQTLAIDLSSSYYYYYINTYKREVIIAVHCSLVDGINNKCC